MTTAEYEERNCVSIVDVFLKRTMVIALLALAMTLPAFALKTTLTVAETTGTNRRAGTVTSGIPFEKGVLKDTGRLVVSTNGTDIPAQFSILARWPDGSVRWALVDCLVDVPAGKKVALTLRDKGKNPAPRSPVSVKEEKDRVILSTGPMTVTLDRKGRGLLSSIQVNGKAVVTPGNSGLALYTAEGARILAGPPDEVVIEAAGPVRGTVMLRGKFPKQHKGLLGYTLRVTAFAGSRQLKARIWLENRGAHGYASRGSKVKPEWYAFDGLALELGLALGKDLRTECEGVTGNGALRVFQGCRGKGSRGEPRYGFDDFTYSITSGDRALKKGARTDGVVAISGSTGKLTAAIRHFWQNYEKATDLDGGALRLWLWPRDGQWPRDFGRLSGYARRLAGLQRKGLYNLPGSVHKGHEIILDFSGRPPAESAAELSAPLFALAPAAYYAQTEAAPGLFAPPGVKTGDDESDAKLAARESMARGMIDEANASSILKGRRSGQGGFWYGWMDFGDMAVPGTGPVSLHYDWPWIATVNAMRLGDARFIRLADEMVRHRVDVDQQWSDSNAALPNIRGFARAGRGFPQFHCGQFTRSHPSVDGTWLAGLVLYHMLTGDAKTKESIDRAAAAIERFWATAPKSKSWYVRIKLYDMQNCARSIFSCCALYDLTGDKKWLGLATQIFHSRVVAKWKWSGAHLHDRQQIRKQDYTRDDRRYCYSIQALCLLHHRTGDKKVLELLRTGSELKFPANFFGAPVFLADLHAYTALVLDRADLADDAVELYIEGAPESASPPVYLPANSQWSRRSAMYLRSGHLLQYCFWKKQGKPFRLKAAPPLPEPKPAVFPADGKGPLVLEVEDFLLVRVQARDLKEAGNGKAALFNYLDGFAARKVLLPAGTFEIVAYMLAPHDEADAFFMRVGQRCDRLVAEQRKQLGKATPMRVKIREAGVREIRIGPAELDFYLDRIEIRKVGE
jgi:exo-rhamnogalacturonan lyase-like protein